jgi:hypothetical protein
MPWRIHRCRKIHLATVLGRTKTDCDRSSMRRTPGSICSTCDTLSLVEKGSKKTLALVQITHGPTAAMRNFSVWKLIVYRDCDRMHNPYFITVFGTSFAWDRHNRPEVFTSETSNHGRQSGGVVVEISERIAELSLGS